MAISPRCYISSCRRLAWAESPFCFDHLIDHVGKSLPPSQYEKLGKRVSKILNTLTYREREVLMLRYMSLTRDGYTYSLRDVGRIFKVSSSTAARTERRALQKLRHPARFAQLKDFIEVYQFGEPSSEIIHTIQVCNQEILKYLAKHTDHIYRLSPQTFEQIVAEIMASSGFEVELTQKTRDGGRDIMAVGTDGLGIRTKYIVECKRYAPTRPVPVELVRSLYGVKLEQQADHAILATTSYFTRDAVRFSGSPNVWNLHLKAFEEIAEWIRSYDQMTHKGTFLL